MGSRSGIKTGKQKILIIKEGGRPQRLSDKVEQVLRLFPAPFVDPVDATRHRSPRGKAMPQRHQFSVLNARRREESKERARHVLAVFDATSGRYSKDRVTATMEQVGCGRNSLYRYLRRRSRGEL